MAALSPPASADSPSPTLGADSPSPDLGETARGGLRTLMAGTSPTQPPKLLAEGGGSATINDALTGGPTAFVTGPPATFNVTYNGFTPSAQAAFEAALDIWSTKVSSTVPINITATWTDLSSLGSVLGAAGPISIHRNYSGAPSTNTWYPSALANSRAGVDLNGSEFEIEAIFNSQLSTGVCSFPNCWYLGTDGNPSFNQYDFQSVVLHEIGHGLGFLGSFDVAGGGSCCQGPPPANLWVYDRFAVTSTGTLLSALPRPGSSLTNALQSSVLWDGTSGKAANSGTRPKLYTPASWQNGSSYSHLDEGTYPAGNPNALMTPRLSSGEVNHQPGPITLGMFEDMGWILATPPPPPPPVVPGLFHAGDPQRVLDTRNGTGVPIGMLGTPPSSIIRLGFASQGVPANATAVVISLVATNGTAGSFLSVFPDDGTSVPPVVSNVNFGAFATVNNLVTARLDPTTHRIAIANAVGATDVVADLLGWYDDGTGTPGERFTPIAPLRALDTRNGTGAPVGKLGTPPASVLRVGFSSFGVPSTATAVVFSLVSTNSTNGSFLSVWPDDGVTTTPPEVSNVNFGTFETRNNLVVAKLHPTTKKVAIANKIGLTDVVADVVGYFGPTGTSRFSSLAPVRVLDTRSGLGTGSPGKLATPPGASIRLETTGFGVPTDATAIVISLVATNGTAGSFLTVWPDDGLTSAPPAVAPPNVSNVNFGPFETRNNLVSAKLDPDTLRIAIANKVGSTDVVADLVGFYAP